MKLIHKNFLYTAIVTSILTILVLGYFVFMLPSLYVDYISNENYNDIIEQHRGYLKDGSYKNVKTQNFSSLTFDIHFSEDSFVITGKAFQTTITPKTDEMKALFIDIKSYAKSQINGFQDSDKKVDKDVITEEFEEKFLEWEDALLNQVTFLNELPITLNTVSDSSIFDYNWNESTKIHYLSKDTFIIEGRVSDGENHYTNYMGFTFNNERLVISYLPIMTPQMNEIRPIVLHSLPMLLAVIILFALVVSYLYSNGIVDPIIKLVKHTEAVKRSGVTSNATLTVKGNDEIAMLIETLNGLYEELDINYKSLENKNNELIGKSKRQEVFLRSSSHQLKTPVAAALLLVDGMINQIGKYQDTKIYLPELKKQLLSMSKIVEDILYLSRSEENITFETVDLNGFIANQLTNYEIPLAEGNYKLVTNYCNNSFITADTNLLAKILDNLISNGIVHSKEGATITISTKPYQFEVHNSDAHIDEELMANIFEPFISGNHSVKGHGLGLYIVTYYAKVLGATVEIDNTNGGVLTKVVFDQNNNQADIIE